VKISGGDDSGVMHARSCPTTHPPVNLADAGIRISLTVTIPSSGETVSALAGGVAPGHPA
jgi:hypothetical protein